MQSFCEARLLNAVEAGILVDLDQAIAASGDATASARDSLGRALLFAVQRSNLAAARLLVGRGASIEAREPTLWRTPLILAAFATSLPMTEFLLDNGAVVETEDDFGYTALNAASESGGGELVDLLISRGAIVDHRNDLEWTPLLSACACGNLDAVVALAKHDANIEARSVLGWTPLIVAAQNGHADIVARLLDLGARTDVKDSYGRTALTTATMTGAGGDICELLFRHVARYAGESSGA